MAWLNYAVCFLLFVLGTARRDTNHDRERTDSTRMFAAFPHVVAVFTSNNHTSFKCLSATRTRFNAHNKTATYIWHLKAHSGHPRKDVSFDISFGETPGQGTFVLNNDTANPHTAYYRYSDYRTCAVTESPYDGSDHCTLWVKKNVKHNVPRHCLDKYEETCDVRRSPN
uniref:Lipocalin n=1 Tax=Amblyomma maculatum TaxID=34609 RepID=G3MSI2_AMBMU